MNKLERSRHAAVAISPRYKIMWRAACCLGIAGVVGCSDDDPKTTSDTTTTTDTTGTEVIATDTAMTETTVAETVAPTLCEKYGGAANVASVVTTKVVPELAGDCRINTFFTSLPQAELGHVVECLSIQVQGLFGCPGVTYAGSMDSHGVACRDMKTVHTGLGISQGDFDALIADVVAGMTAAGVAEEDIAAAAPALLGMKSDIVEHATTADPTKSICADKTLCQKYGGAHVIDSVVTGRVVPEIAGDCRINTFFTSLPAASLAHVVQCLSIQAQGLFGCKDVTYAGSKDANGIACRDMKTVHTGLGISQGDFDALIEDVAAGLGKAGVSSEDIGVAAPALVGLGPDIVEKDASEPTQDMCTP